MERDQIEESKNRTIYNARTIAVIESVYEERERPSMDFPRKISPEPPNDVRKLPTFRAEQRGNVAKWHHPRLMLLSSIITGNKRTNH